MPNEARPAEAGGAGPNSGAERAADRRRSVASYSPENQPDSPVSVDNPESSGDGSGRYVPGDTRPYSPSSPGNEFTAGGRRNAGRASGWASDRASGLPSRRR